MNATTVNATQKQSTSNEKSNNLTVQKKLRIGAVNDVYEQEADRVATQVVEKYMPSETNRTPIRIQRFNNQSTKSLSNKVPLSVEKVITGSGKQLNESLKYEMERNIGYDFSKVRVHTGSAAEKSARDINAHAYTVGNNIVFSKGQTAFGTSEGKRLLAHELTHTVQQSMGNQNLTLQRDVIDDVRDNLSYSFIDWAVTDSEAMESLALLGSIDPVVFPAEIARLGPKYVTRLLDNLPDAAKTGEVYERLITTIGAAGVAGHAIDQLSYGLFDWAITDADVTRVFNVFTNLPEAQREKFLTELNASGYLDRLIDNSTSAHHSLHIRPWIKKLVPTALTVKQKNIMRVMVENTEEIETLKLLTETRFNIKVGPTTIPGRTPADWTASNMSTVYLVLDKLPDAHVANNKRLLRLGQFEQASKTVGDTTITTGGVYSSKKNELALNTKATGDIKDTIRHETGHSVDKEMGWRTGPEPAKPSRGGWKSYKKDHKTCATEMVDDSNGGIKSDATEAQRKDVITKMTGAISSRTVKTLKKDIKNLPWYAGLEGKKKKSIVSDKSIKAIGVGLEAPWFNATDGGVHLGHHVYQESYTPRWVRYRHEARSRLVSKYQFRAPGEWFAECYDRYYEPDDRGLGAKLNDVDPSTKTYFDTKVNTRAKSR